MCCTYNKQAALTFLLLLGRPSALVLLHSSRAVRANRGAVNAGVLLLRLVLIHILALAEHEKARGQ